MISIITPLFNHCADLTSVFIRSMQECLGDWELILVDNGSTDETWHYIKASAKRDKRIKLIKSDRNLGFAGGNNLGFSKVKGDEICFISNDVLISNPDWLNKLSDYLKLKPMSMLGPQYVGNNQLTAINYKSTPYLTGHCIYGSRKMFDKIAKLNGVIEGRPQVWDESFNPAYFEDTWLSQQALDLGYQLTEVPGLGLTHLISRSSDKMDIPRQTILSQLTFFNKMMIRHLTKNNLKRIVFYAGGIPYPFIDEDYEGKGVGGSEASIIQLARSLAKKGWQVEIYNTTLKTGKFNGVYYYNAEDFRFTDYCDVFVLFRVFDPVVKNVNAMFKLFWSCDQYTQYFPAYIRGLWNSQLFPYVDCTICASQYHKEYLEKNYRVSKIKIIDLGINWQDYAKMPKKIKAKGIFCSVPERGLERLLRLVPELEKRVPDFKLVITSDYRLWGSEARNERFIPMAEGKKSVEYLGKIPRAELVKHQLESELMIYPSNYEETFCISAMECLAAGAVPVTIDHGAIKTTVDRGGVVLSNVTTDDDYLKWVTELFKNRELRLKYVKEARQIAKQHDWFIIADQWLDLINNLESGVKMTRSLLVCPECGTKVLNDYVLKRHMAAKHAVKEENVPVETKTDGKIPQSKTVLLKFKTGVECMINGKKFGCDKTVDGLPAMEVKTEEVPAIIETITNAYGDVLA